MKALLNGNDFRSGGATSQGCTPLPRTLERSSILLNHKQKGPAEAGPVAKQAYRLELRPSPTGAKAEAEAGGDADVVLGSRSMTGHEVIEPCDHAQVLAHAKFQTAAQSRGESGIGSVDGNTQRRSRNALMVKPEQTVHERVGAATAELQAGTKHIGVVLVRRGSGRRGGSHGERSALRVAGSGDVAFQAQPLVQEERAAGVPAIRAYPAAGAFIQAGVGVSTCQLSLGHQLRPGAGSANRQRDYQDALKLKHFVFFS